MQLKFFLINYKGSTLLQTEMANLSRQITREELELRSILPKADSDPDDFISRICHKALGTNVCQPVGTGADPTQSREVRWQLCKMRLWAQRVL